MLRNLILAMLIILPCTAQAHHRQHVTLEDFSAALARAPMQWSGEHTITVFGREVSQPDNSGYNPVFTNVSLGGSSVLREASRYLGDGNITGRPGKWCKWFVNLVLERTGHYVQPSGRAVDSRWLGPSTYPHPGAIAYTRHHTAFVVKVSGDMVLLLGGNQGHRVSYMWHSMYGMNFVEPVTFHHHHWRV